MSAEPERSPTTRPRQPLWPWLLMPLVTLAMFLALRNARQMPAPQAKPVEAGAALTDSPPASQPR